MSSKPPYKHALFSDSTNARQIRLTTMIKLPFINQLNVQNQQTATKTTPKILWRKADAHEQLNTPQMRK